MKENILFIAPLFNGYYKHILRCIKLSNKYDNIYFKSEYPLKSLSLFSIVVNLFPNCGKLLTGWFNKKILDNCVNKKITTLFIIRGEYISAEYLKTIKKQCPNINIILYQWDSIHNNPNASSLIPIADKAFSFDYSDVKQSNKLIYLSLFNCWEEIGFMFNSTCQRDIDILFIGGYRNSRQPLFDKMTEVCERNGLHFFCHSYMRFIAYLKNRKKLNLKLKDIAFTSIDYHKYYNLLLRTKIVFDIHSPSQSGLTMRTFEALSLGCKLITTNENIKKESFYNSDNIVICSFKDIPSEYTILKLCNQDITFDNVMSLNEWLKQLNII